MFAAFFHYWYAGIKNYANILTLDSHVG